MKDSPVTNRDGLRARLEERHGATGSWRAVAVEFGNPAIKPGTLHAIARRSYEPKRPDLRRALGLPELATVTVCVKCGQLHIRAICPNVPHKQLKRWPRPGWLFDLPERELRRMWRERQDLSSS